jgi:hypothetical protein
MLWNYIPFLVTNISDDWEVGINDEHDRDLYSPINTMSPGTVFTGTQRTSFTEIDGILISGIDILVDRALYVSWNLNFAREMLVKD